MPTPEYDVVVVGTSPLSLLESVIQARAGRKVCLLERDERIGGVWKTEDCLGFRGIETTPHVFLPESKAYDILDRELSGRFNVLPVQPRLMIKRQGWLFRNADIPVTSRLRLAFALTLAMRWDKQRHRILKRLARTVEFGSRRISDILRQPRGTLAKYPEGGLTVWFDAVLRDLASSGVELRLGTTMQSFAESDDGVCVELADGSSLATAQIVLNTHVQFESARGRAGAIPIDYVTESSSHYTIVIQGAAPMGFVQAVGHADIMLINDVSDYADGFAGKYPGCRLVTLRTNARAGHQSEDAGQYFSALMAMGYLPTTSRLVTHHYRLLTVRKISRETAGALQSTFGRALKMLVADDLSIMSSIAKSYK